MMNTKELLYLESPDLFSVEAKLLGLSQHDNQIGLSFSETVFYPQGGGQPSDVGIIKGNQGVMAVTAVKILNDSVIHFGQVSGDFEIGCHYTLAVDQGVRHLHSRLHTAGELICCALRKYDWKVTSAKHWPDSCKIVLDTQLSEVERAELQLRLQ